MDRKVKITIECDIEVLLSYLLGNSNVAFASEDTTPPSTGTGSEGNGEGSNDNNENNNNENNDKENTGRPGAGVGITGPGRPSLEDNGNE